MAIDELSRCDNHDIDFGVAAMTKAKVTLERAKLIANKFDSGLDQSEICDELKLHRAQVYNLDYLARLAEPILGVFLLGNVAMMPLIKSHKKHGDRILPALQELTDEKSKLPPKASRKITLKEIEQKITGKPANTAVSPVSEQNAPIETLDARRALSDVMALLMEASEVSQDADKLVINSHDAQAMQHKLNMLEQWMDELNPTESGSQGDPTNQAVGSYVFKNMVDPVAATPSTIEIEESDDNSDAFEDDQYTIEYDPEYLEHLNEQYAVQSSRH